MSIRITNDIMAIQGLYDNRADCYSIIHLVHGQVRYPESPNQLIERMFENAGGSFSEAKKHSRMVLNRRTKVPVTMAGTSKLIMMPVYSMGRKDNTWLVSRHIKNAREISRTEVVITFSNNTELTLQIDKASYDRQVDKAERLMEIVYGE